MIGKVLLKTLFECIVEGLLLMGFLTSVLSLFYLALSFDLEDVPYAHLPYLGIGFLWGFFSIVLNFKLEGTRTWD